MRKDPNNNLFFKLSLMQFFAVKRWLLFGGGFVLSIMTISFLFLHPRLQPLTSFVISTIYQSVLGSTQVQTSPKPLPIKHMALANPDQIHFEFYSSLPNMKIEIAEQKPASDAQMTEAGNKTLEVAEKKENRAGNHATFDATELEKSFSNHVALHHYIIQLGIFHQLEAANRFRSGIFKAGLPASVVSIKQNNRMIYRVQQGPYYSLQQTQAAQQQLQKKGLKFLVRSIGKS